MVSTDLDTVVEIFYLDVHAFAGGRHAGRAIRNTHPDLLAYHKVTLKEQTSPNQYEYTDEIYTKCYSRYF